MAAPSQPSLFGSTTTTTGTGGGGGLFGGAAPAQTQQAGGGLFGSSNTAAAQPAQGGGGGLFNTAATQPAPAPGGGLFNTAQNTGGSLFGGGGNTNTGTSSLFGQKPAQPSGLFGGQATAQPAQATSGGLLCVPPLPISHPVPPPPPRKLTQFPAAASTNPRTSSNLILPWAPP